MFLWHQTPEKIDLENPDPELRKFLFLIFPLLKSSFRSENKELFVWSDHAKILKICTF